MIRNRQITDHNFRVSDKPDPIRAIWLGVIYQAIYDLTYRENGKLNKATSENIRHNAAAFIQSKRFDAMCSACRIRGSAVRRSICKSIG